MKKVRIGVFHRDDNTHTYPCLKYYAGNDIVPADPGFVVLFTSPDEGVVLSSGEDDRYDIGHHDTDWSEIHFKFVEGTFKIRNN